jgi:ABC-2 type transport system ATP-binding protein
LKDKIHTQVRKLSLGERMKCELVAALLHSPRVVFLDEPTIGLDVVSQKRIRDFLKQLHREDGCSIILTSHYMQDVQELCDRVVVIDQGALIFDGALDALANRFSDSKRIRLRFKESLVLGRVEGFGKIIEHDEGGTVIEVPRTETAPVASRLLQELPVEDIAIEEVEFDEVIRALFSRES